MRIHNEGTNRPLRAALDVRHECLEHSRERFDRVGFSHGISASPLMREVSFSEFLNDQERGDLGRDPFFRSALHRLENPENSGVEMMMPEPDLRQVPVREEATPLHRSTAITQLPSRLAHVTIPE